jgi:ABC-2 type transport system ATP-binding protein
VTAVRFEAATKHYGTTRALEELTLEVAAGTLFALVGPNGAGKTTTIGLLTGLLTPTAGRVLVFGADVAKDPLEAKRRIGFVPDRPYVFPRWTPRETLRFVGAVFGMKGWELEGEIASELEAFGITDVADVPNDTLSHGTRQKVALAQAFVHRPDLLVLDEPRVGLDPHAPRRLVERLRARTAQGAAVFFTTHQLSLAEETASMCGLLHKGHLAALGPTRELAGSHGLAETFFRLTGT